MFTDICRVSVLNLKKNVVVCNLSSYLLFTFKEKKGIRGEGDAVHSRGYVHRVGVGGLGLEFRVSGVTS